MRRFRALLATLALVAVAGTLADDPSPTWRQWGGPEGDFRAPARGLAATWPEGGPKTLWNRELGPGYSAILFEGGRLYTQYRAGDDEAVICLDAVTGKTIWEQRYRHLPHPRHQSGYGDGPNSTPVIAGNRIFTVGIAGAMHALDKRDGKILWTRELWGEEFGGNLLSHGYSSSPLAYGDTVIVPVGGANAGLVAFNQADGSVKWKGVDLRNSFSSPSIVNIAGERELLVFMAQELIGVDPDDGELRWRFEHGNQWNHNIVLPTVLDGNTIFLSSPQVGARGLHLTRNEGNVRVEEI